jgi:hypothetical protein
MSVGEDLNQRHRQQVVRSDCVRRRRLQLLLLMKVVVVKRLVKIPVEAQAGEELGDCVCDPLGLFSWLPRASRR